MGIGMRLAVWLRRTRVRAMHALRPVLPARLRLWLRSAERRLDPLFVWLYRRRTGESRPIPPRAIRERNSVEYVHGWFSSAERSTRALLDSLEAAGREIGEFRRALDFGCAGGKVIASLRGTGPELHGCDIHGPSIEWLRRAYPDLRLVHSGFHPPLPYPDGHFDLVWAWSVLTHLDGADQRAWMAEWARVVEPGGLVLATFNGPAKAARRAAEGRVPPGLPERLARDGVVFLRYDTSGNFALDFAGTSESYGDTYNSAEWISGLATEAGFEFRGIAPKPVWQQDCAILVRGDGEPPARASTLDAAHDVSG